MVASLALAASLLSPVPAAVAAVREDPWAMVPTVESTGAAPMVPTIPSGDFSFDPDDLSQSAGLTTPGLSGKARTAPPLDLSDLDLDELEVVDRDEFATAYVLPSGRRVAVLSEFPQNVLVDDEWVPLDGVLERAAGGGWSDVEHPLSRVCPELCV